ncbi:unnamed protein product [Durusdinium trenchii]|uniref:Uncharacterized protein n=2 Tax=Durusdinium trenchii TaxID=1381693 RepID=A0ABP0PZD8_9DINO
MHQDLRLSSKIDCTEPGELIKTEESKTEDGHEVFRLKTSNSTLVLERQAAPDKDEPLVGDWTFESGDFKIVKKDSGLELEQKFWNKTIACSANLTKKDSDDKHYTANLVVKGSDCKNFKLRDCPTELCQADKNNSKCEAAKDLTFGFVKLELESDNNAIKRTVSASEAAPGKSFNVKRSFVAVDAEADAFVCVKVNETWEPIRRISYKQLANGGSQKQEIQKAEESKGTKIFEGKSIGKDWVQEDHVMEDSIFTKDEYLPPWKKSIQATVQWKKAVMCPEKFPLCYKDGDCVSEDCKNGCEWSRSPTVDAKTDMDYNYIAGADTLGTACDKSNEAHEIERCKWQVLPFTSPGGSLLPRLRSWKRTSSGEYTQ